MRRASESRSKMKSKVRKKLNKLKESNDKVHAKTPQAGSEVKRDHKTPKAEPSRSTAVPDGKNDSKRPTPRRRSESGGNTLADAGADGGVNSTAVKFRGNKARERDSTPDRSLPIAAPAKTKNDIILSDEAVDDLLNLARLLKSADRDAETQEQKVRELQGVIKLTEKGLVSLEKICSPNQLIWRIDDFKKKFLAARKEEKTILYSPCFETHRNGYKVALSLCPNGDGRARGTYMSLFFCILQGAYDSLLEWPFAHKLTFTLLDQSDDIKDDVTCVFSPHTIPENIPFLGKPSAYRNPSIGLPKFMPIVDLWKGKYVADDTLFIMVAVDVDNIIAV